MEQFFGTKHIAARPMTRLDYNIYRGWDLPADEDGSDDGYLVEYMDGGKPNHPDHEGYISWSPKEQFENAYQPTGRMSFGHAIAALKEGKKVARAGWNGKGMWLVLVNSASYDVGGRTLGPVNVEMLPWIGMKTAGGGFVPWLASQTDILINDWMIVE
ncbi:DUF2829 domain-containing protein [Cohaesibacter marisflavi]|uniref:DUF2829 domain-containing protein n=1 Tax=Cohaesibacter marisflavi TaxID=655353 RepID=UPI0029C8B7EB|nr:DUF2829 domain-containing protein [Cohaesibacter marisflavi]